MRMPTRFWSIRRAPAVVALLACAGAARAQTTLERARFDSLRAVFAAIPDSATLKERERSRIAWARQHRDDPAVHLELGLLAFRLGEVTGERKHYDDAAGEFEWAAELRPDWPVAWYWLGVAELAVGEHPAIAIQNIRQWLGLDELSKAVRAFARAVEADPAYAEALVELATVALRQRIAPRLAVAQRALRLAAQTPGARVPGVLLMRGLVERRLEEHDSALAAFRAYVAAGGDPGVGLVEQARTQAALGRPDSALAGYRAALARAGTDSARAALRHDVQWIASPEELRAFDALPDDSVGDWLQQFWSARDVADGRRSGERLLEQFRRWHYAWGNFQLVSRRRSRASVALAFRDTTQDLLDDRGVIYLRHGEPDRRARFMAEGFDEANETWLYRRSPPEQDLVFHFVPLGDVQDYRLVESLAAACGASADCFAARAGFGELYDRLAHPGSIGRANLESTERFQARRAVERGTRTDSYRLRFPDDVRPVVTSFVVGDAERRPELHVVFAIPARRLHALDASGVPAYALSLRVVVFDSLLREAASVDTLRIFRSAGPLPEDAYLTEQLVLSVPPGTWRYHFVVEELQAGAGAAVTVSDVEVPRFASEFSASDVVLGWERSGLVWRRLEGPVPLNPLQWLPRDATLSLFYEVYGLAQGASVETRVRVVPRGGRSLFRRLFGGGGGAELAYTTVTDAPGRSQVRQRLDLTGLRPGRYTLEVELEETATGRRLVRSQPFEIVGTRAS
jgi:GWxTD domain-containing protein